MEALSYCISFNSKFLPIQVGIDAVDREKLGIM